MQSIDSLASLSIWAVAGIIAVVAAAAFGSTGFFLRRQIKSSQVRNALPFAGAVFGAAFGALAVYPSIQNGAAPVTCDVAQAAAAEANATEAGREVDPITTGQGMTVDCLTQTVVMDLSVDMAMADVTPEQFLTAEANINEDLCGTRSWRRYIQSGWTLVSVYTFADGGVRSFTVNCDPAPGEPVAAPA